MSGRCANFQLTIWFESYYGNVIFQLTHLLSVN